MANYDCGLTWIGDSEEECHKIGQLLTKFDDIKYYMEMIVCQSPKIRISRITFPEPLSCIIESSFGKHLISRRHATIERTLRRKFVIYNGSINGKFVNNVRIKDVATLEDDDAVRFGHINKCDIGQ